MGERRPCYRDRDRGVVETGKYWRPPRSHGGGNFSVPLWEKRFCTDACAIPWGKLCEAKRLMPLYKNVVDWDDSAALEAFRDAKARFCAEYHGQPCDIPLPNPYMYIDMVNPDEHVDPELVADLENTRHAVPKRDSAAPDGWDSFIFTDKPVPATGWGDGETSGIPGQQCSINWDSYVEQPFQSSHKQSSGNWDNYVEPVQTSGQQRSGNRGMCVEQPDHTNSGGEPTKPSISNWVMQADPLDAWKHNYGWGSAAIQVDSWGSQRESYHGSDNQGGSYGHWRGRNNESSRRNSRRNREGGSRIGSKAMKTKYHSNEHNGSNNGWKHCRGRNNMHYSYEKPGYAKQYVAM